LEASFELLVPIVIKSIVDTGIGRADKVYIIKMCLLLILLGVVGMVCSVTAQYFSAKASVDCDKARRALFRHIGQLSYTEIDTLGTSSMITRMTSDIKPGTDRNEPDIASVAAFTFYCVWCHDYGVYCGYQCGFYFCCSHPCAFIVVFAIMLLSIPLYRKVQQRLDRVLKSTRENLTGVR